MGLFTRRSKDLFTVAEPGRTFQDAVPAFDTGFRMTVIDVFAIQGRGTVLTGTVEAGSVTAGTSVTIERTGRPPLAAEIDSIEMFRKRTKQAGAGDNVGLLFRGLARTDIATGDVIRAS